MKVLSFLTAVVLIFSFSGCSSGSSNITPITKGIYFNAELEYYNEYFKAEVLVEQNGDMKMLFSSPNEINGLSYTFNGDEVTAEYLGLSYKTDISETSNGAVALKLYNALRDTQKEKNAVTAENDNFYIKGKDYKLYLGATGLPISLKEDSGALVSFKNVTILKN